MGVAAAFSFYPGKNLGACGEAGAVTTNDAGLAQKVRMLRDHGQAKKYYHDVEGYNGRLDAIQAGILAVKLKHLPKWTELRRQAAGTYRELFSAANGASLAASARAALGQAGVPPFCGASLRPRWSAKAPDGSTTLARVSTTRFLCICRKRTRAWDTARGAFPVCEKVASEILSLPMYPGLEREQQQRVVDRVLHFVSCSQGLEVKRASGAL